MITDSDFNRIVMYVKRHCGIDLSQKRILVNGRLKSYLLRNGYNSCGEFMDKVESSSKSEESNTLINVLTTNHTYFMWESVHFDFMQKEVLPYWKARTESTKDLRIWSAASSTGEEPYTIAMVLMDYFRLEPGKWEQGYLLPIYPPGY